MKHNGDTCHYKFVQTYRMYSTKAVNPKLNWTLGDDDVPVEVQQFHTAPLYGGMLAMEEDICAWGNGIMGNLCTFLLLILL